MHHAINLGTRPKISNVFSISPSEGSTTCWSLLIIAFIFSASPASVGRASVFGAESPGEDSPIYLLRPGSRPLLGPTLDFPRLFTRGKGRPCFYFNSFFDARVEWFDKTTRCRDCLSRYYKPTSWGNGFKLDQNKSIGHGYIFLLFFCQVFSGINLSLK